MTCDNRSLYLDCLSCKCQKSCKNSLCHVAVPIYFDKESDNEQDSPISPSQGNLTFKKIIKRCKSWTQVIVVFPDHTHLLVAAKCGKMYCPKIKLDTSDCGIS